MQCSDCIACSLLGFWMAGQACASPSDKESVMLGMSFSAGIHCVAAFSFSVFRGDCSSLMAFCLGL